MSRFTIIVAAAAGMALAAPALADDAMRDATRDRDAVRDHDAMRDRDAMRDHDAARKAADDALASKAELPAKPPELPSTASDRATYVHDNIAFGKRGEEMRAAHAQHDGNRAHADDEHAGVQRQGHGHGAMGAAGAADADAHDAAEHAREHDMQQMHGGQTPGGAGTGGGMQGGGGGMQDPGHRH